VIQTEIKAVTYHELYVRQVENGWEAQVIFDV
jgi:SHS2 domain-containing protein